MHREIRIEVVLNGYLVHVGCQTVVFQTLTDMIANLQRYLVDPKGTEIAFARDAKNGYREGPAFPEPAGRSDHAQDARQWSGEGSGTIAGPSTAAPTPGYGRPR